MPKVLRAPTQGPLLSRLANSLNTACECKKKGHQIGRPMSQTYISDTPSLLNSKNGMVWLCGANVVNRNGTICL